MPKVVGDFVNNDLARLILAVLLTIGTFALLLTGRSVPDQVYDLDLAAIVFYFTVVAVKSGK